MYAEVTFDVVEERNPKSTVRRLSGRVRIKIKDSLTGEKD